MILLGTILLSFSCIEQFDPKLDDYEADGLIVVEGQITDEVGPFRVKFSHTFEVDNMQLYGQPVLGADVQIFDDKGNQYPLFYTVEGWYETDDKKLQGVVGNTYTLNITLADGTQYESSPVLMQDVPEIDSVYFDVNTRTRFDEEFLISEDWLDIYVDAKDPTGNTEYWKWDFEETWEVRMLTDSLPFMYNVEKPLTIVNIKFEDHVRETCWVTVTSKYINLASTEKNLVDEINKFRLHSIPPKSDKLHIKYSILVKQTALTPELYNYFKKLEESAEESGGMYEKMPEQIFGNIDCCSSTGKALGYFTASAIKSKRIFINFYEHSIPTKSAYGGCIYVIPDDKAYPKWRVGVITYAQIVYVEGFSLDLTGEKAWTYDEFCTDCREYGTHIKPDFWE